MVERHLAKVNVASSHLSASENPDEGSRLRETSVSRFPRKNFALKQRNMREWLSGRASPCQGERREFESRFPLHERTVFLTVLFLTEKSHATNRLHGENGSPSDPVGGHKTLFLYSAARIFCKIPISAGQNS